MDSKAPTGTEILQSIETGKYRGRIELLRDVALNLYWVNRNTPPFTRSVGHEPTKIFHRPYAGELVRADLIRSVENFQHREARSGGLVFAARYPSLARGSGALLVGARLVSLGAAREETWVSFLPRPEADLLPPPLSLFVERTRHCRVYAVAAVL